MSDARRAVAAAAYALVGRNLHPRLRAGYGVRNFLARELSAGVAPSAQIGSGVMLSRGVVLKEGAGIGSETWLLGARRGCPRSPAEDGATMPVHHQ